MNKLGALLIIGGVAIGPCLPLDAFVAASSPSPIEASATVDRYIVQFAAGTDPDREAAELSGLGVEVAEVYHDVFPGAAVFASADLVAHIRTDATVVRVEPDQMITLDAVPPTVVQSDPPWGLDRIDQRSLPLSNTYSYNDDGSGVTAYIIDSGINAAHVDFGGRVRSGISTVGDTPSTDDCVGHGTHVAGIVGGQTYGVAKNVSLVAVRVLDCNGTTSGSQLIEGLDWVVADHQAGAPAVANLSIGGAPSTMVDDAVQALINDGVTVAIAAGNESQNACNVSPARTPAAITVAASTETDARSAFSNFGSCVDLFAPGSNIPSDFRGSPTATAIESGTSMAAPHVAGAAAALLSVNPAWTPAHVAAHLLAAATPDVIIGANGSPNRLLYSAPSTPSFVSLVPARLLESRSGVGVGSVDGLFAGLGVRAAGSVTELLVAGRGGVAGDASAVVLTVTVTEPAAPGFVSVFPCGGSLPLASSVNFVAGATVANSVVSGVGVGGRVCVFTSVDTQLVVDVDGFFPAVSSFVSLVPARLLESRSGVGVGSVDGLFAGLGVRAAGSVTELLVAGRGGVAGDASAVVLTVTVTEPVAAGFVSVFPCGGSLPLASSVNFVAGASVANSVVSGVGVGGRVCLFTSVATQLVVDVNGYFQ